MTKDLAVLVMGLGKDGKVLMRSGLRPLMPPLVILGDSYNELDQNFVIK